MPQAAIAFISNAAYNFLITVGAPAAFSYAVTPIATGLVYGGLTLATAAVAKPRVPNPSQTKIPLRQTIAPRQSGFGRARLSGPYMLFEEYEGDSYDVIAFHDGEIDAIEARWLHDDSVTVGSATINSASVTDAVLFTSPTDQYTQAIRWNDNLGAASQTAHAALTDNPQWGSAHRGDGVASVGLRSYGVKSERFGEVYPYALPRPSVTARLQKCFDPREAGHDPDDQSTWEWTDNPVCQLLTYLIRSNMGGMGFDYARRIEPSEADWIAAANVCDETVTLKAGGSHKRYTAGGVYLHNNDPADVIAELTKAMDGWLAEAGDGSLTIIAGKYSAPTVTLTDDHIISYQWRRFRADEEAVNELQGSYTSPEHKYEEVQGDPWTDQDDIDERGQVRSRPISLPWVQSHAQHRRLLKRAMKRMTAGQGVIVTNLFGLQAIGERYIGIQNSDVSSMADIVGEVQSLKIDFQSQRVEIAFIEVDSTLDAWTPASEEGDAPTVGGAVTVSVIGAPTIDSVDVLTSGGLRMQVNIDTPTVAFVTYLVRYRRSNEDDPETFEEWKYESFTEPDLTQSPVPLITSAVAEGVYEVQAATVRQTGSSSAYSTPAVRLTVTAAATPDAPGGVTGGTI